MTKTRVGVIGANPDRGWASLTHLPALAALPEFDLTAVCTTRQKSADAAAEKFGARRAYDDYKKLVNDPDIDLVVVCVRVDRHFAPVMAALEAGKHVFCEWPLGHSTEEAAAMTDLACAKGVVNQVGLQTRVSPVILHARELIDDGFIGSLRSVTMLSSTTRWGGTISAPYLYGADAKVGVNVINIHAGHSIDALCVCVGELQALNATVANIRKQTRVIETNELVPFTSPDQLIVNGTLSSGAVVAIHMQSGVAGLAGFRLDIRGTDGDLVITSEGNIPTEPLRLYSARIGDAALVEIAVPETYVAPELRHLPQVTANVAESYRRMAKAIGRNERASPDFEEALARHRLLDTIRRASSTGQRQTVHHD